MKFPSLQQLKRRWPIRSRRKTVGVILTAFLVMAGVILGWPRDDSWSRPPQGGPIYGQIAYNALKTPPLRGTSVLRTSLEKGITTTRDSKGDLQLTAEWAIVPGLRFDSVVERDPEQTKVKLSQGAEIELKAIGALYAVGVEPADQRFNIYDPTCSRLLSDEELTDLGMNMGYWRNSMQLMPGALRVFAIFDGPFERFTSPSEMTPDTYQEWISSMTNRGDGHRLTTWFEDYRWHDGPVEFVWDIAHGKMQEVAIAPKPGEMLVFADCKVKVVALEKGQFQMRPVRKRYGGKFAVEEVSQKTGDQGSTIFLTTDSPQLWRAMDCALLDRNGEELSWSSHFWPDQQRIAYVSTMAAPEEVAQIRIRYRSAMDRVFFMIPSVPGVPEEDKGVENLFNVRIPYLELKNETQFAEVLSGGTQLDMDFNYANLADSSYYPKTFKDVSMRELVAEAEQINKGRRLVLDLTDYSIRETRRPEWLEAICSWFRSFGGLL